MKGTHPIYYYRRIKRCVHDLFFYYIIPDAWEIRHRFKKMVGYKCHLGHPRTFNEKIQWLKLHDRNPLYPKLIDKISVKDYVSEKIGDEYVIPTLAGGFSHFDDIPFKELPDKFVLKCNHDSKSTIICTDKQHFVFQKAKQHLEKA
ncbi:MAG: glycosyl transferase, partial [Bacteroidales bacterium]|nr:glycosyl transferase [Bacteroidales bacterium]